MKILRLYRSPEHTYYGHHGKPPGDTPMESVDRVECVAGRGIRSDRFFDYKENYRGQITFFAYEIYQQLCERFGRHPQDEDPAVFRRNALTSGIDLNTLIGEQFEVQGVRFEGTVECTPCYWMDQAFAPGTEAALKGNGGLRARILTNGELRVDQAEAEAEADAAAPAPPAITTHES